MHTLFKYLPEFMHQQLFWVVALLALAICLFIQNKLRMDVIALLVMLCFSLSGILTTQEIFAGLSDPSIVLIALLYIVGAAIERSGIAYQISDWLTRTSGSSETKLLVLLMISIGLLGALMSPIGVVAIFIPVVLALCTNINISPRRLMMPLNFAGLISGMMTIISATNLVTNSALVQKGYKGFHFFSFTPVGLTILVIGIIYMLIARRWLGNCERDSHINDDSSMSSLINEYHLYGRAKMVIVQDDSPIIGKEIDELKLRSVYRLNIIAIQRYKNFRSTIEAAFGRNHLQKKDILLMDIGVDEERFNELCEKFKFQKVELKGEYFSTHVRSVGMVEMSVIPESETIGKTIDSLNLRSKFGLSVVGIKRENQILQDDLLNENVRIGDIILVMGIWQNIMELQKQNRDFFFLAMPKESKQVALAANQAPHALFAVFVMVFLMVMGFVPNVIAALIGCLLLGLFRCIDLKSAYESIRFPSLILIVGMIPFSTAMQKTGGVNIIVQEFVKLVGLDANIYAILFGLFVVTALVGLFISNTATAILMAPIAIEIAEQLHYSPYALTMVVAVASSAAFMTPISSPVNTMVVAPAGYKFMDFVKIGVPFTIIVMLITIFLVPVIFPI